MGFDGKTLIHPKQLAAANAAFAPSAEEIDWARRVIAAHAEAERAGRGVVLVDGRLVENLHVEDAHRISALAAAINPGVRSLNARRLATRGVRSSVVRLIFRSAYAPTRLWELTAPVTLYGL